MVLISRLLISALVCFVQVKATVTLSVRSTVLILGTNSDDISTASYVLNGYGIPYTGLIVPQTGLTLPALNTTSSGSVSGNFGLIVVQGQVSYDYGNDNWASALTTDQWNTLYAYQITFGVRMVQMNVYPSDTFGAAALGGCCNDNDDQTVTLVSTVAASRFPFAGLNSVPLSTSGLWHYPAKVTDTNTTQTTAFLKFQANAEYSTESVGGVINSYPTGQQQMVFFTSFGTWSATSTYLSHIWIQWGTRGLYSGMRRAMLGTQVDDLLLTSDIYSPAGNLFRLRTGDLNTHVNWTTSINTRLNSSNPGTTYFLEFGFNGNGDIIQGQTLDPNYKTCKIDAIYYDSPYSDTVDLEFEKTLGAGSDVWPTTPSTFNGYSMACLLLDPLTKWLQTASNRDAFAYVSHTYTHLSLNNATYHDVSREIIWNQQWANMTGLSSAKRFSNGGLIPPAITGLHNGDALKAFSDNGLHNAVGDNTRPVLRNPINDHWPLITSVSSNGFAGFQITPRWATNINYNCDTTSCDAQEWNDLSGTIGDIHALLTLEKQTASNQLLGLYQDPYMFHQANLRQTDVGTTLINGQTQRLSLFQMWVETVTAEYARLVNWPIITLKHDDIAAAFKNRMTRDGCMPNIQSLYSSDGKSVTGVVVTTTGNVCSAPIPVTLRGTLKTNPGFRTEQVGKDPLTVWVTMSGSPVTLILTTPISLASL